MVPKTSNSCLLQLILISSILSSVDERVGLFRLVRNRLADADEGRRKAELVLAQFLQTVEDVGRGTRAFAGVNAEQVEFLSAPWKPSI